ncbi:hypothetical protein HK100_006232 [Physocladia obscura]|uniref:Uncharacterized protein n=1 Tax=Physocladia obscura TaxID=109957 RepID=A0AAD5T9Q7_9FUNG|nr:hypothetical protein HK100_006232 [Physocladia obscura]
MSTTARSRGGTVDQGMHPVPFTFSYDGRAGGNNSGLGLGLGESGLDLGGGKLVAMFGNSVSLYERPCRRAKFNINYEQPEDEDDQSITSIDDDTTNVRFFASRRLKLFRRGSVSNVNANSNSNDGCGAVHRSAPNESKRCTNRDLDSLTDAVKRIKFFSESLVFFNSEEAPQSLSKQPHSVKKLRESPPLLPESFANPIDQLKLSFQPRAPSVEFQIISSTSHGTISTVPFKSTVPITFETVSVIPHHYSRVLSCVKLRLVFLVENIHPKKIVTVCYTTNGWDSHTVSKRARRDANLYENTLERFCVEIDCSPTFGSELYTQQQQQEEIYNSPRLVSETIMQVEFSVTCLMNNVEYCNNRNGLNHVVLVGIRESFPSPVFPSISLSSASTPPQSILSEVSLKRTRGVLDSETQLYAKHRATMFALEVGQAMANEAKRIDAEFRITGKEQKQQQQQQQQQRPSSSSKASLKLEPLNAVVPFTIANPVLEESFKSLKSPSGYESPFKSPSVSKKLWRATRISFGLRLK